MKNEKLILIDSNNIAYRAFYALPDTITTSSGIIVNAVLGFTNMLLKLIEDENPDSIICAFDSKAPTFRHEIFNEYKIHRKKMPDELSFQLPLIKEVLEAFNISCFNRDGFEADDILATLASRSRQKFKMTLIVTGDKDIMQLVSDNVRVLGIKRGITDTILFDEKKVQEKFGVEPGKIKDLLALMGDSSDNIPGIPGIGPKTALSLVKKYGTVEEIYENLDKIGSPRLNKILADNKKIALLSKELVTLKIIDDLDIESALEKSLKKVNYSRVKQVFESLEFKNLQRRLPTLVDKIDFIKAEDGSRIKIDKIKLKPLTHDTSFQQLRKIITGTVYIFLTGSAVNPDGLIIYNGAGDGFLVGLDDLGKGDLKKTVKSLFEDEKINKSGFDFKNIFKVLAGKGIDIRGKLYDFKILYLILTPTMPNAVINDIVDGLFNIEIKNIEFLKNGKQGQETGSREKTPEDQLSLGFEGTGQISPDSSSQDIDTALKALSLYEKIENRLIKRIKEEELEKLYWQIEEPLVRVLSEMEQTGVNIDKGYLDGLIKEYDRDLEKLTKEIYEICGEEFNINSSKQLAEILYKKLKLPITKKTRTGLSTDAGALRAIYDKSPVIEKLLSYREKAKLKNTYIDVLPRLADQGDQRVHTTYHQLGTSTGRISSSNPNLQNIPVRTEFGKLIRKAFIPGKGYSLLLASDYSQIELRVLAHLSGDENLLESFNQGEDIHARTASEVFGVKYEDIDEDLRRKAKAINFGIVYGMTEFGLGSRLSIPEDEARDYIKKYFERYPGVNDYLKSLIETAHSKGYAATIFGRRRYLKELGSSNTRVRSLGERFAVNTPIQGSAADIMKLATIDLYNNMRSGGIDSNIILHVHDELVLELKKEDLEKLKKIVRESMEDCIQLKVKLKVDIAVGKNWYI